MTERAVFFGRKVFHEACLNSINIPLHLLEKEDTLFCNTYFNNAPVVLRAGTMRQAVLLKAVEEPGDVGGTMEEPGPDVTTGQKLRMTTSQDTQYVVLSGRDVVGRHRCGKFAE